MIVSYVAVDGERYEADRADYVSRTTCLVAWDDEGGRWVNSLAIRGDLLRMAAGVRASTNDMLCSAGKRQTEPFCSIGGQRTDVAS